MLSSVPLIQGVLFDLDGTLVDSAPDLGGALNELCLRYQRTPLSPAHYRRYVSQGARGLLQAGFDIQPGDLFYEELRDEFLALYEARLSRESRLFDPIPALLQTLEKRHVPWGIVTNKVARFTQPLTNQLGLFPSHGCLISGDTCAHPKPWPDPLFAAARRLQLEPAHLIYVGDDERDMNAAQAAGMGGVIAGWGYLAPGSCPIEEWPACAHLQHPAEVLDLLPPIDFSRRA